MHVTDADACSAGTQTDSGAVCAYRSGGEAREADISGQIRVKWPIESARGRPEVQLTPHAAKPDVGMADVECGVIASAGSILTFDRDVAGDVGLCARLWLLRMRLAP